MIHFTFHIGHLERLACETVPLGDSFERTPFSELFRHEIGTQLKNMRAECKNWVASSYRIQVFGVLLSEAGSNVGFFAETVVGIFVDVLTGNPDGVQLELQLKMFILLSKLLYNTETTGSQFSNFTAKIVQGA